MTEATQGTRRRRRAAEESATEYAGDDFMAETAPEPAAPPAGRRRRVADEVEAPLAEPPDLAAVLADEEVIGGARSLGDDLPGPWGGIVKTMLSIDPAEVYARLERELRFDGDDATNYGEVLALANRAESNYHEAYRLSRVAQLDDEHFERTLAERLEILRTSAKNELGAEVEASKDEKGKATKRAPTIQDIEDRMVANWPDEYHSLKARKAEMHAARRVAENLVDAWRSRQAKLNTILDKVAPTRGR